MDATAVVAIITLAGSLLIASFTSRSAKTDKVVPEYVSLTKDLREQVNFQGRQMSVQAQQIEELQQNEARRKRADAKRAHLQHIHEIWDRQAHHQWSVLASTPVPEPPPLDVWD